MSRASPPVARPVAWPAVAVGLAVLAAIVAAAWVVNGHDLAAAFAVGALVYLAYSWGSRAVVARHHRAGMRALKAERFREAEARFAQSGAWFDRHPWVDRWRSVVLLSSGTYGYREMALLNRAYAFVQLGDGDRALDLYRRVLDEYPGSMMAQSALRAADAFRQPGGGGSAEVLAQG